MASFVYSEAFSRNIGWVTPAEQELLRTRRVAIAGLGGVGGSHLLTLTRLGIGKFSIADFDTFELPNFNRQAGATLAHLGRPKVDVLAEMALDINPDLLIQKFPAGVDQSNLDEFLRGAHLYVDGLDYFAVEARRAVFASCTSHGIPAITAAPLGMSVALLNFLPGKMSFEEYFQLENQGEEEQLVRFLLGLSPRMLQMSYLVNPEAVDFSQQRGPSTAIACGLCAAVASAQALRIFLRRGKVLAAPHGLQFDAYRSKYVHTWRPGGNSNPIQQLALVIARRQLARARNATRASGGAPYQPSSLVERILDLGRWAPSGDNSQPWRFEIVSEREVIVHATEEAGENVYDYNDGQPSWLSFGCLLETLRIAATLFRRRMNWVYDGSEGHQHRFVVTFSASPGVDPDPLAAHIQTRSVDRRRYRLDRLTPCQKQELERAAGKDLVIQWAELPHERWRCAKLNALATAIRLSIPEAYAVHRRVLDWDHRKSPEGIPAAAVGIDPMTRRLMRWVMGDFARLRFFNTYLGGTLVPRIELDLTPGLLCAAHFFLLRRESTCQEPSRDCLLHAGMAVQRLWLTADRLGIAMQPSLAPLAFASYARGNVQFSSLAGAASRARALSDMLDTVVQEGLHVLFFGRLGVPASRRLDSRSMRLPLQELLVTS